jgi:hypothetical protein
MTFYAKRTQADGQYARRQTDQDEHVAQGGWRPTRALSLEPVSPGHPEALEQSVAQVLWGEINLVGDTERLGLVYWI